ncbi:MAG TPA: hypothetical protein VJU13_08940 [Candidatus Nitrosocosmicus sp.]|nr:hypothetical protein [Candidatus Nitrosocosmicus sp.]
MPLDQYFDKMILLDINLNIPLMLHCPKSLIENLDSKNSKLISVKLRLIFAHDQELIGNVLSSQNSVGFDSMKYMKTVT